MSEIRYDRLHDTHVIIAPERLHRPECEAKKAPAHRHSGKCPFCEGNESMTPPEIFALRNEGSFANEPGWLTRVVPNLYKAVQIETPNEHHFGAFEFYEGFGAHEVIIDTPHHRTSMMQLEHEEIVNWLATISARVADLRRDGRIACISAFKNEGTEAGATQPHVHTQLIGLPMQPLTVRRFYERSAHHYREHGASLLQTVVEHERQAGERIIMEQDGFVAYCPYASAYPFEIIIADSGARGQIDTLGTEAVSSMAAVLQTVLHRLEKQLGCVAFNLEVATPPLHDDAHLGLLEQTDAMFGVMLRIMPRIYRFGGFELSTQTIINPVVPEEAALLLREETNG
jgi:UDPglucose--hexose-1-phosphate uridylyltransferase